MRLLALLAALAALGLGFFLLRSDGANRTGAPQVARPQAASPAPERSSRAAPDAPAVRPPDAPPSERGPFDASARKASDRSGPKSVVSGTVIASDPIQGAQITIVDGEEVLAEAESDRGGAFRLEFPAGAETRLRVRARGWSPLEVPLRSVQPGQTRMLGNLRLEAGKLLQGVVYGAEGRPLPDAQVLVSSIGTRPTANAFQHRTKTDALGRFQVTDVPLGRTHVQASAAGHERRIAVVQHGDGQSVEIRLGKETTLRVRVRGPGGEPVPEAHVSVHSRQERQSFDARADEDGICMFHGLAPGRWTLRCTEAGFRPVNRVEEVGDATEIELQLAAWPCVTGKVASSDGSALGSGVRVDVLAAGDRVPENAALVVSTGATDENGAFRVCGLRPGDYRVRVQAERFAPSLSSVFRVQVEGDVGIGTLEVDAGSTLQLSLSVEGEPLGGASVQLFDAPPPPAALWGAVPGLEVLANERSDARGRVSFPHLAPGRVWAVVRGETVVPSSVGPFAMRRPERSTVELAPGGWIEGEVRDADGRPSRAAVVLISGHAAVASTLQVDVHEGRFRSPPLPGGGFEVEARALDDELRTSPLAVDVEPGKSKQVKLALGAR